jgi:cob(I)alamin adenosyltransferase
MVWSENELSVVTPPVSTAGFVHVYTGDGKGKTTAALGLALRAAGAGWMVFIAQFLKSSRSSEFRALMGLSERITVRHFGREGFVKGTPRATDHLLAERAMDECREVILTGNHGLVVLDEANVAVALGLLSLDSLLELIHLRPVATELVITGRWAHPRLIEIADLVTEMREVKHYFRRGVLARAGVED